MNLIDLINNAEGRLAEVGIDTARLDAEVLIAHVLGMNRVDIYTNRSVDLTQQEVSLFHSHVERRAAGCPVAYITGVKEFWSIPMNVTPDVLIPRPETEHVVQRSLEIIRSSDQQPATSDGFSVLDLCTGSGCIAAALAKELPEAQFIVTDISEGALGVARKNLASAAGRIKFLCGDLFDALLENSVARADGYFDLITANPPYVSDGDWVTLPRDIRDYEPREALVGGNDGLDFAARIVKDALSFLKPTAWLVMEVGIGQVARLRTIARECGGYGDIVITKDLAGIERVISVKREAKRQEAKK